MAMHKALKPFGWYPDGHTREALEIGDERDFGDVTDGLVAAKMIAPVGAVEAAKVEVVAPVAKPVVVAEIEPVELAASSEDESVAPAAEEPSDNAHPKRRGRPRK